MIGIETAADARIAIAREIAAGRRAQYQRGRIQPKPAARTKRPAIRWSPRRMRSASRA
jgi:hypothetical protein